MTRIFLLLCAVIACSLIIGCSQEGISPTSGNLNTANTATMNQATAGSSSSSTSTASPSPSESQGGDHHVTAPLVEVGGSGVSGHVTVEQLPKGGVNISVVAFGLNPGDDYLSLYYENHVCALEPYEEDDVIGEYTANAAGVGHTQNKLGDDLDEVNSISVRRADFTLIACADIHP
jgi:hypothetical protein